MLSNKNYMKRKGFVVIIITIALCTIHLHAEGETIRQRIQSQVEDMQKAFINKKYDVFIGYMPTELIEMMGGKDKVLNIVSQDPLDGKGRILNVKIIKISDIVEEDKYLASIITVNTFYYISGKNYLQQSYIIGQSKDKGYKWKFIAGNGRNDQEQYFKKMFPNLTRNYSFPECFMHESVQRQ